MPFSCSLHVKAFQELCIVFCHNNGLVVYPRGSSDAQTYKTSPPSFCYCCQPYVCVCREKPIMEKPPEPFLKKENENTLVLLLLNNKCSHHHPLLHVVTVLFSSTVCLCSLQTVVKDNMMNKTSAHKENLGFYRLSSHNFYFIQS